MADPFDIMCPADLVSYMLRDYNLDGDGYTILGIHKSKNFKIQEKGDLVRRDQGIMMVGRGDQMHLVRCLEDCIIDELYVNYGQVVDSTKYLFSCIIKEPQQYMEIVDIPVIIGQKIEYDDEEGQLARYHRYIRDKQTTLEFGNFHRGDKALKIIGHYIPKGDVINSCGFYLISWEHKLESFASWYDVYHFGPDLALNYLEQTDSLS